MFATLIAAALSLDPQSSAFALLITLALAALAGLGTFGVVRMQDQLFPDVSHAMPNGAATTNSTTFDLGIAASSTNDFLAQVELEVTVPTFTTGQLGDGQTITISVLTSDTADLGSGSPVTLATLGVFTGAGGAGAAGNTFRFRPPTNVKKYLGTRAVKTGASNASTANVTNKLFY